MKKKVHRPVLGLVQGVLSYMSPSGDALKCSEVFILGSQTFVSGSRLREKGVKVVLSDKFSDSIYKELIEHGILLIFPVALTAPKISQAPVERMRTMQKNLHQIDVSALVIIHVDFRKKKVFFWTTLQKEDCIPHAFRFELSESEKEIVKA